MQWLTAADATAVGIPADLEADPSHATTPDRGTYERKWVDACIDATREEASQKMLADGVIYGFCGCVAKRVVQTVTLASHNASRLCPGTPSSEGRYDGEPGTSLNKGGFDSTARRREGRRGLSRSRQRQVACQVPRTPAPVPPENYIRA